MKVNKREKLFWEKVDKGDKDECWEWLAGCFGSGYGAFWNGRQSVNAHRYAWRITNGPIEGSRSIYHVCGNKKCVNPNHLSFSRPRGNYEKRFWSKVNKGNKAECWEWSASCKPNGYGEYWDGKSKVLTHRYAWKITHGPIPGGMCVLHHCDNRKCINPNHLFLGTHKDNAIDRDSKCRDNAPLGEDHGCSKLTKDVVIEIRERYAAESISQRVLSEDYPVSQSHISDIVNNKCWKHI